MAGDRQFGLDTDYYGIAKDRAGLERDAFNRGMYVDDRNFSRGTYESDRNYTYGRERDTVDDTWRLTDRFSPRV